MSATGSLVAHVIATSPEAAISSAQETNEPMRFTAPGNPETRTTAGVLSDAVRSGG